MPEGRRWMGCEARVRVRRPCDISLKEERRGVERERSIERRRERAEMGERVGCGSEKEWRDRREREKGEM